MKIIRKFLNLIPSYLKEEKYKLALIVLLCLSFVLSFYCWNCYGVKPDLSNLRDLHYFLKSGELVNEPYTGPPLLLISFLTLLGKNLFTVRLGRAIFVSVPLLVCFLLGKEMFDKNTAIISSAILLLFPFFILMKFEEWIYVSFLALLSVYLWIRVLKNSNYFEVFLFGLISGLALYQKLIQGYMLLSLFFSTLLLNWYKLKRLFSYKSMKILAVLFLGLIIGSSPLILYNYQSNWASAETSKKVLNYVNFGKVVESTGTRFRQTLKVIIPRKGIMNVLTENFHKKYYSFEFFPVIYLPLTLVFFSLVSILKEWDRKGLFLILFTLFLIFFTSFIPKSYRVEPLNIINMVIILPFLALIFGKSLTISLKRKTYLIIFLAIFIPIIIFNLMSYGLFYSQVSNQEWLNENYPSLSPLHTNAMRKIKETYPLKDIFFLPYHSNSIEIWTRGICERGREIYQGESLSKIECSISEVNSRQTKTKLILPYPGYLKNSSKVWRSMSGTACNFYNKNKSSCYLPYRFMKRMNSTGKVNIEERGYITDVEGKRAYVVLNVSC